MTTSTDHTLRLWLTLAHLANDPALLSTAQSFLDADIQSPLTDVTAEWQGRSLLLAAMPTGKHGFVQDEPVTDMNAPLTPQPHETLALKLIDRGLNPWQPLHTRAPISKDYDPLKFFFQKTVPLGYGPAFLAFQTRSWSILQACLRHPQRPAWAGLMAHQDNNQTSLMDAWNRAGLVKVLIEAGLPVNWQDQEGHTLLHRAQTSAIVTWLVQQGGDLRLTNHAGQTPLQLQEAKQTALTPELRGTFAKLLGNQAIAHQDIWSKALTGKGTEVFPYFPGSVTVANRAMLTWRWASSVGTVNLLDAASLAAARRPEAAYYDARAETALLNRLLALPGWPESSVAMARLLIQHQQAETQKRLRVSEPNWTPLSEKEALAGMQRYLQLAPLAGSSAAPSENFAAWLTTVHDPHLRHEALDVWLAWRQTGTKEAWQRRSSVGKSCIQSGWGQGQEIYEVTPTPGMTATHRVALIGEVMVSSLDHYDQYRHTRDANLNARYLAKIRGLLPSLITALRDAHVSLNDPLWKGLAAGLQSKAAHPLQSEITAILRSDQAAEHPPTTPRRARLRS
jgi:hypothetical protein